MKLELPAFLARLIEEAGARVKEALSADSLEGRADKLREAWSAIAPSYEWGVCDVFDDAIMVRNGTEYRKVPYTIDGDTITFGEPLAVAVQYQEVGEAVRILEAKDKTGSAWRVRVVRFGTSANGWHWTRESGEALLPHLKTTPVGCYVYQNGLQAHAQEEAVLTANGPVTRNIVGDITNPSLEADGVYADLHIHEDAGWLRTKLLDLDGRGLVDKLLGLSVDTLAGYVPVQLREGVAKAIKSISRVFSVDIVTAPSADGRFLRATAGPLLITTAQREEDVMNREQLLALVRESRPQLLEGKDIAKLTDDEIAGMVREAMKPPAPKADEKPQWAQDLERTFAVRNTQDHVREALGAATTLPELVKERIRKDFAGKVATAEEIGARVKEEIEFFAKFHPSGEPSGHGAAKVVTAPRDKVQAGLDQMFGITPESFGRALEAGPFDLVTVGRVSESLKSHYDASKDPGLRFRGLRHAYVEITGDHDVSGRIARVSEAQESSNWGDILGNTLYRRFLMDYAEIAYNERSICEFGSAPDFRTREITMLEYFPDIATVDPESADYAEIVTLGDDKVTYNVIQKGNLLTITRKTIINDDLRGVQKLVERFGRAFRRTLARAIWTPWISNSNYGVDATAWFHVNHGNTGSTALTADATGAAEVMAKLTQLADQKEPGSLEKLGFPPRAALWLDVPTALFGIADLLNKTQYFGTTAANQAFQLFGANGERINVNPLFTDATDWGVHVTPGVTGRESLHVDFLQGRQEPEFFLADQPTIGQMFVGDKLQWKGRHEYNLAVIADFRGGTKNVVAG